MTIPESIRTLVAAGPLAHLTTLNRAQQGGVLAHGLADVSETVKPRTGYLGSALRGAHGRRPALSIFLSLTVDSCLARSTTA